MSKIKSGNNSSEKLVGEIPKKRNIEHLDHQMNYKGTGFCKNKKKKLFRKRKHK
jgi:hypothetical protein